MWSAVFSVFGQALGALAKIFPFLLAFKAGGDRAEKKIMEKSVKTKTKGDTAAAKTREKLRKEGVADYVKNNDI